MILNPRLTVRDDLRIHTTGEKRHRDVSGTDYEP